MTRSSTLFLRLAILVIGLGVAGLLTLLFPSLWHVDDEFPSYAYAVYVVLAMLYVTSIPYFLGLTEAWRILNLIDASKAYTLAAANGLRFVSRCAGAIAILYLISLPFFYIWADGDDAPGLVVIGMLLTGVPMVAAVSVALLQRLLREAIELKNEHDMTV